MSGSARASIGRAGGERLTRRSPVLVTGGAPGVEGGSRRLHPLSTCGPGRSELPVVGGGKPLARSDLRRSLGERRSGRIEDAVRSGGWRWNGSGRGRGRDGQGRPGRGVPRIDGSKVPRIVPFEVTLLPPRARRQQLTHPRDGILKRLHLGGTPTADPVHATIVEAEPQIRKGQKVVSPFEDLDSIAGARHTRVVVDDVLPNDAGDLVRSVQVHFFPGATRLLHH